MVFTTVALSSDGIHVEANVNSVFPLSIFINKLKSYSLINTVSLDKIESKPSNALISVGISTTFKKQGGANAISNN